MVRFQRGSLRKEDRKAAPTWVLKHYVTRQSDGKRVEHKIPIRLVRDFKTESAAWAEMERQHLSQQINEPVSRGRVTFSAIARHYVQSELPERAPSIVRSECIHRTCPPSAAVRHRAMASSTLTCFQVIHLWLRSMNASPAARTRSATSSGGQSIYSSYGDLSLSFSESSGLAVAFQMALREVQVDGRVSSRSRWPSRSWIVRCLQHLPDCGRASCSV
jgi:hypothetical protein